jgi:hypothetical protein
MSDKKDDKAQTRDLILRRRARFVSVALAGLAVATEACDPRPTACLSVERVDPTTTAQPTPCLSPPMPEDAGTDPDAGTETEADAGADAGTESPPRPCLSVTQPKDQPRPCLSVIRPPPEKK